MRRILLLTALGALGAAPGAADPAAWTRLISFRPPEAIQRAVIARGPDWAVHRIEDAAGRLSLDAYTVVVERLPRIDGRTTTAEGLLEYVRIHFGQFTDSSLAAFAPLTDADARTWASRQPAGAVLLIDMKLAGVSPDSGCVVVARADPNEWIFSTIRAGAPGLSAVFRRGVAAAHPVSGNRAFGWSPRAEGGYLFYTSAADRPTRSSDSAAADRLIFPTADRLWRGYQERLARFVNDHGGRATVGPALAHRFDWPTVRNSAAYYTADQPGWVRIRPR